MDLKQKSRENFLSANLLCEESMYRSSCSRYYYAMYLRLSDICINKLNYTVKPGSHSHVDLINFYQDAIRKSQHSDRGKKSVANNIARNIFTAKDYRKDADYTVEEYIDENICKELKRNYEYMLAHWSDINEILS